MAEEQLSLFPDEEKAFSIEDIISTPKKPQQISKRMVLKYQHLKILMRSNNLSGEPLHHEFLSNQTTTQKQRLARTAEACKDYEAAIEVYEAINEKDPSWQAAYLRWHLGISSIDDLLEFEGGKAATYFGEMFKKNDHEQFQQFFDLARENAKKEEKYFEAANLSFRTHDFEEMLNNLEKFYNNMLKQGIERGEWHPKNIYNMKDKLYKTAMNILKMGRVAKKQGFPRFAEMHEISAKILSHLRYWGKVGQIRQELKDYQAAFDYFVKGKSFMRAINLKNKVAIHPRTRDSIQRKAIEQRYLDEMFRKILFWEQDGPEIGRKIAEEREKDGWIPKLVPAEKRARQFDKLQYLFDLHVRDYRLGEAFELLANPIDEQSRYLQDLSITQARFKDLIIPKIINISESRKSKDSRAYYCSPELLCKLMFFDEERVEDLAMIMTAHNRMLSDHDSLDNVMDEIFKNSDMTMESFMKYDDDLKSKDKYYILLHEYYTKPVYWKRDDGFSHFVVFRAKEEIDDVIKLVSHMSEAGSVIYAHAVANWLQQTEGGDLLFKFDKKVHERFNRLLRTISPSEFNGDEIYNLYFREKTRLYGVLPHYIKEDIKRTSQDDIY